MKKKLIGLVGIKGSGKSTVGEYLQTTYGYKTESFANTLKDAVSAIFGWPRHLLEGDTAESRIWREQEDRYWSDKLKKPVTPRWVLQQIGTDVLRNHFFDDIWICSLERKLSNSDGNIVLTDVRFQNEIAMVHRVGGEIWWVRRDPEPVWLYTAIKDKSMMPVVYPDVHSSEYAWIAESTYKVIQNNSTIDHLKEQIEICLKT